MQQFYFTLYSALLFILLLSSSPSIAANPTSSPNQVVRMTKCRLHQLVLTLMNPHTCSSTFTPTISSFRVFALAYSFAWTTSPCNVCTVHFPSYNRLSLCSKVPSQWGLPGQIAKTTITPPAAHGCLPFLALYLAPQWMIVLSLPWVFRASMGGSSGDTRAVQLAPNGGQCSAGPAVWADNPPALKLASLQRWVLPLIIIKFYIFVSTHFSPMILLSFALTISARFWVLLFQKLRLKFVST